MAGMNGSRIDKYVKGKHDNGGPGEFDFLRGIVDVESATEFESYYFGHVGCLFCEQSQRIERSIKRGRSVRRGSGSGSCGGGSPSFDACVNGSIYRINRVRAHGQNCILTAVCVGATPNPEYFVECVLDGVDYELCWTYYSEHTRSYVLVLADPVPEVKTVNVLLKQGLTLLVKNMHVVSRGSQQHDVETNPGPPIEVSDNSVVSYRFSEQGGSVHWNDQPHKFKVYSWFGGTRHLADVQVAVVAAGVPMQRATIVSQQYVAASARSAYFLSREDNFIVPAGVSDHAVADAFKASYFGSFRADYLAWLSTKIPRAESVGVVNELMVEQEADMSRYGKVYCENCGFFVVASGHHERCRVRDDGSGSEELRCLAWFGDAVHILDVRRVLIKAGVKVANLQLLCERIISAEAQSAYMREQMGSSNESTRTLSTRFESLYRGSFRRRYLHYLKGKLEQEFGVVVREEYIDTLCAEPLVI